ncbi:MAG: histone deacetylase family protein [Acidimicrobiales bacterium]
MGLLLITHPDCAKHVPPGGHPERPTRLTAALDGISDLGLGTDIEQRDASLAPLEALLLAHKPELIDELVALDRRGGGGVDPDTSMSVGRWRGARLAAGAGLDAVIALQDDVADAAIAVVRPPGHNATPTRAMGFCLLNNVAVTAAVLADGGERVVILDFDAHHGNGTQAIYESDPRVLFVSLHQYPFYPGSGAAEEVGLHDGRGYTVNVPIPAGAGGETYRQAMDIIVEPAVAQFDPTWLLISAGFDGHRDDRISQVGLTAGDFADLTKRAKKWVPAGRTIVLLEGGYDLASLRTSTAAVAGALVGSSLESEALSDGAIGAELLPAMAATRARAGLAGFDD